MMSALLLFNTLYLFSQEQKSHLIVVLKKKKIVFSLVHLVICSFMCIQLLSILKDPTVT